ncbi:MAG: peptidoglycan DD-metalloendopeptidase family protein [Bacteroidales bacterium]|nr:peptidoglycan DD-metalloendopeptidase family protein [Bacteroidales bacterium]
MKTLQNAIGILGFIILVGVANAQHPTQNKNKEHKSEIKVNKLDVIYEDEEYKGVVIDRKNENETESSIYQAPFIVAPPIDDYDEEEQYPITMTFTDEGATSEDEILLEGYDTAVIHLPKLDVSSITQPILITLRDELKGQKFTWPTPLSSRPSSHFGPRRRRFHYGLDLAQPTGEPIYAAFDGVVRISRFNKSYGNLVIIHHANGLETYYAHMSKRIVSVGQQVKSGDIIGLCGNTGRSFGSHLHFEIRYQGNAMNPENVVDCKTHDLISDQLEITSASFRKVAKGKSGSTAVASSNGWYKVRQGDTLEKIARRNGTTVKRLCQLNNINQNKVLHPGDMLKVSGTVQTTTKQTASSPSKASTSSTYTVKSGDTLTKIASRNGTTVKKLCQLNNINENKPLQIGQKIRLK